MIYFFDSSALVKLYHRERGSEVVEALFAEPGHQIIVSRLAGVEFHSALALKVRTGHLDAAESLALRLRFLEHVTSGAIMLLGVHANHYANAEDLIVQHGNRKGLRTLDALQLAVALDVQARVGLDAFVVADTAFAEIAKAQGVSVTNPEATSGP